MFSIVRKQRRPLGYSSPESRLELQLEKALFRQNAQVLRDMCDFKGKQKRREVQHQYLSIDQFSRQQQNVQPSIEQTIERKLQSGSFNHASNIAPQVRWLLTRSARLQRANDADFSKYSKPVRDRVLSANGKRGVVAISMERQRSMCSRNEEYERSTMQRCHCELLGPSFCSDCTKIKQRVTEKHEQAQHFPRIEVHTRSLVAPERIERLFLSHPQKLFNQNKSYACGCPVSPELEITTPLVYTPHEIFERIRRKKNIEFGNDLIRRELDMTAEQKRTNTPVLHQSYKYLQQQDTLQHDHQPDEQQMPQEMPRPSFYEEKTEPPMDMTVSVSFRSDGPC